MKRTIAAALLALVALGMPGCDRKKHDRAGDQCAAAALAGVDLDREVVRIGMLNDDSGPAAILGKRFANGRRLRANRELQELYLGAGRDGRSRDRQSVLPGRIGGRS